ncbi:LGFP repeat-containing protein [Corynebacterium sp. KPL2825]|uniref:LGFP repeat-containing protein n=1 Tax=Corynebacterium sp. KPL2825 TaxID=3135444 RepID=UPI0030C9CD76
MQKMTRRIVGGFAAATLSVALVACSDAEDAANDAKDTAGSVAADASDAAGSAVDEATSEKDKDAESSESEDADGSESEDADSKDGDTKTVSTANGDQEVPAALASAIEEKKAEWGDVQSVESSDKGSLATFDGGNLLAMAKDGDEAQPIVGKIAETWKEQGGLDAEVGLPKAAEEKATEGKGWTQQFDNGVISWVQDESGKFTSSVEK